MVNWFGVKHRNGDSQRFIRKMNSSKKQYLKRLFSYISLLRVESSWFLIVERLCFFKGKIMMEK